MMEGLDPFTQTATATPEQGASAKAVVELPASIARFRIERQLGAGAMGVVYAAFDPDLERRVAVKVLRAAPGQVARHRLLREARAMARLSHPNVVTVHEVGTSGERDYVATEMIIGSNLSEWLRAAPRSKREIVDAFLAAGRGLVAAHEAGLVHRDFKPHNVLRSNDGRIVVTDFGLARASHGDGEPHYLPPGLPILDDPSTLEAELTRTGALVGTPGYMAPEQWAGLEVDGAADQFSFCVALWEAVAGQRPFQGQTIEELREQVQRPPMVTDAAEQIPRALRNILMRGLAQRPEERYPTMRALIESIEVARRRPRRIAAIALSVAAALAVLGLIISSSTAPQGVVADACPPPILTAETVWSPAKRAVMPERVAKQFDRKVEQWQRARATACRSDSSELRRVRAACLDAVISTIDLAVKAITSVDEATRRSSDVTDLAAWSQACMEPTVPTLHPISADRAGPSAQVILRSVAGGQVSDHELDAALDAAKGGCEFAFSLYATAVAHAARATFGRDAVAAEDAAEACGDDYLRARVAELRALRSEMPYYGPEQMMLLRKATTAVARVADTAMLSHLELIRGEAAHFNAAYDTAIEHYQRARKLAEQGDDSRAAFTARWSEVASRSERGRPSDLVHLVETGREIYREAIAAYGSSSSFLWRYRQGLAELEWRAGNREQARAFLAAALRDPSRVNPDATRPIHGKVVDERGRPLAGVLVLALSSEKTADVDDVDLALWDRDTLEDVARTVSEADGTFAFDVATGDVFVLARKEGLAAPVTKVAQATAEVTLRAVPTGTVYGSIDYGSRSRFSTRASIGAGRKGFHFVAPVAEDGAYVVSAVPPGWYEIRALTGNVSEASLLGRRIRVEPGMRKQAVDFGKSLGESSVQVIVRNERAGSLDVAQIYVLRGAVHATTLRELRPSLDGSVSTNLALARPINSERAPPLARTELRHGDLFVSVEHLQAGVQSVCAIGLSGDLRAEDFLEKLHNSADQLDVRCKTVTLPKNGAELVQISVPPMMRVD